MVKRVVVLSLVVLLGLPFAAAAENKGLKWGGLAMAAGGTTLSILASTTLKKEECFVDFYNNFFVCESGPNQALRWTGAGLTGVGTALAIIGFQHKNIRITPRGVFYVKKF
jgi:hypothetical protein